MIRLYQPKPVGRPARVFQVGLVRGTLTALAAQFNISAYTVRARLARGWPAKRAFCTPKVAPQFAPGARPTGIKHRSARLTELQVVRLRERAAAGEPLRQLARELGIRQSTVQACVRGITWQSAPGPLSPPDADRLRQSNGGTGVNSLGR